jgi:hypothetical protein
MSDVFPLEIRICFRGRRLAGNASAQFGHFRTFSDTAPAAGDAQPAAAGLGRAALWFTFHSVVKEHARDIR